MQAVVRTVMLHTVYDLGVTLTVYEVSTWPLRPEGPCHGLWIPVCPGCL